MSFLKTAPPPARRCVSLARERPAASLSAGLTARGPRTTTQALELNHFGTPTADERGKVSPRPHLRPGGMLALLIILALLIFLRAVSSVTREQRVRRMRAKQLLDRERDEAERALRAWLKTWKHHVRRQLKWQRKRARAIAMSRQQ